MQRQITKGFTLIEILIAMFVFTILASIVLVTINHILTWRESLERNMEKLTKLQVAMTIIERDFQQMLNRPVLTATNTTEDALVFSRNQDRIQINFTRMGYVNPLNVENRSTLQRVGYEYKDQTLSRITWFALDRVEEENQGKRILLENVSDFNWKFYDEKNISYNIWPPTARDSNTIPSLIVLSFNLAGWGKVERYMVIPNFIVEIQHEGL